MGASPLPNWLSRELERVGLPRRKRRSLDYYVAVHRATPSWADKTEINRLKREVKRRRAAGEDVHLDHIIPIKGQAFGVSGPHVPANLEIVSSRANYRKGAHTWPQQWDVAQLALFSTVPEQQALL